MALLLSASQTKEFVGARLSSGERFKNAAGPGRAPRSGEL